MINLETTDDVKLLKELIEVLGINNGSEDNAEIDSLVRWVKGTVDSMDTRIKALEKENHDLGLMYKVLQGRIDSFEDEKAKMLGRIESLETQSVVKKVNKTVTSTERRKPLKKDDDFLPYKKDMNEYHLLLLKGVNITHVFMNKGMEREVNLPIDIFELLAIVERYRKGGNTLKVKEVDEFCDLFGLNKSQFSKIFYNLNVGKFDGVLAEVNKMIGDSIFTIKNSHIYRNNHDTRMDSKLFNELTSIYINDPYPFSAANKLIKERNDIDPFDLFISLKKGGVISKVIGE